MKSEPKLSSVEQQLLSLILPAGLLDYFEIKSVRDIKIGYEVLLEEKSDIPSEYINEPMRCHGFYGSIGKVVFVMNSSINFSKSEKKESDISHSSE